MLVNLNLYVNIVLESFILRTTSVPNHSQKNNLVLSLKYSSKCILEAI